MDEFLSQTFAQGTINFRKVVTCRLERSGLESVTTCNYIVLCSFTQ